MGKWFRENGLRNRRKVYNTVNRSSFQTKTESIQLENKYSLIYSSGWLIFKNWSNLKIQTKKMNLYSLICSFPYPRIAQPSYTKIITNKFKTLCIRVHNILDVWMELLILKFDNWLYVLRCTILCQYESLICMFFYCFYYRTATARNWVGHKNASNPT